MTKIYNNIAERGTLLVEMLAMLGLIAMVTPTLYKKSAERMQEIQDINAATQARTLNWVVETFVKQNATGISAQMNAQSINLIELTYDGGNGTVFEKGFSSIVPFGFGYGEIKNYEAPRAFAYLPENTSSLVTFVVYPREVDPGKKRASRLASLVGANGGTLMPPIGGGDDEVFGTGGAWHLDNSEVSEILALYTDTPEENSLVVTSTEPISLSDMDSEKFLYRVPAPEGDWRLNTMYTDLYMGTYQDDNNNVHQDYYSIFNARKITLNTNITRDNIDMMNYIDEGADLYIGSTGTDNDTNPDTIAHHSTGNAWIHGNLAAIHQGFGLTRNTTKNAMRFGKSYKITDDPDKLLYVLGNQEQEEFDILYAETPYDPETGSMSDVSSRVSFMGRFVQVLGNSSDVNDQFLIGKTENERLFKAYYESESPTIIVNESSKAITHINPNGGLVYINQNGSSNTDLSAKTYINPQGGVLVAGGTGVGAGGEPNHSIWIHASNNASGSTTVNLLEDPIGADVFTVGRGSTSTGQETYMMKAALNGTADHFVSLRDGIFTAHSDVSSMADTKMGGIAMLNHLNNPTSSAAGAVAIAAQYTDVLGSTYLGGKEMGSTEAEDGTYVRNEWALGVAGSAWVDDMLWARSSWILNGGIKELHAGFYNFDQFKNSSNTATLNAYKDQLTVRYGATTDNSVRAADADTMVNIVGSSRSGTDVGEVFLHDLGGEKLRLYKDNAILSIGDSDITKTEPLSWVAARRGQVTNPDGSTSEKTFAEVVGEDTAYILGGGKGIESATSEAERQRALVDIQNGAIQAKRRRADTTDFSNSVVLNAGNIVMNTSSDTEKYGGNDFAKYAQFHANSSDVLTRNVDFTVKRQIPNNGTEHLPDIETFKVKPMIEDNSSDSNVTIRGSVHITQNDVIHFASHSSQVADDSVSTEKHAMFEVDPNKIQVWAKSSASDTTYAKGDSNYYAMVKINPYDVGGSSSASRDTNNASIYVRRGAIELEANDLTSEKDAADAGYGYIKAGRLVANQKDSKGNAITAPAIKDTSIHNKADKGSNPYDKYMVNPAYTSVMHDIKLITRGGARLSDILPDYILKGIYYLKNDCKEGTTAGKCGQTNATKDWASHYVGIIPFAVCPPGYTNVATLVPTSFNIGRAGDIITETKDGHTRYKVNDRPRQATILDVADSGNIIHPRFNKVESFTVNSIYNSSGTISDDSWASRTMKRTEGWFLGLPASQKSEEDYTAGTDSFMTNHATTGNYNPWEYSVDGTNKQIVAEPLYFQQSTWLKTVVNINTEKTGWSAFMGFLYDSTEWGGIISDGATKQTNITNQNVVGATKTLAGTYYWNLFPIPTNSIEGEATVYCYFNRTNFKNGDWENMVDQVDQLGGIKENGTAGEGFRSDTAGKPTDYGKRLNDPSLKYDDPW